MLIELDGCVFDQDELTCTPGLQLGDPIDDEAFVNHIHFDGADRQKAAAEKVATWISEMKQKWPAKSFRIYRQVDPDEITIRFHMVRENAPTWADSGLEIIEVGPKQPG